MIIKGMAPDGLVKDPEGLAATLLNYAKLIEPWAMAVAEYMIADVWRRDRVMWKKIGKEMSTELRRELEHAPTGLMLKILQEEQVTLIKSIPLQAAERVHALTQEAMLSSTRAATIAKDILETENVTQARATLIARTETSRVASNLVQARAQYVGSEGYIWRTADDGDVRPSHAEMDGKYVRWSHPPKLDNLTGHAGCLPNCRCFADPVFPDF